MRNKELVRKVQLMGGSTLIISLPKEWTKKAGINPGDFVYLHIESDNSLRVMPKNVVSSKRRETVINVGKEMSKGALVRELMSRYLTGYKVIVLNFHDGDYKQRKYLKSAISKKLIGVEVLEESSDRMVLQVLVNVEELTVNTIIQRMTYVASGMLSDSLKELKKLDKEVIQDIIDRDDIADKLYLYILRQLNAAIKGYLKLEEIGLKSIEETLQYGVVAKSIERVADHAQRIAMNLLELSQLNFLFKENLYKAIYEYGSSINKIFRDSVTAFLTRNRNDAHNIMDTAAESLKGYEKTIVNHMMNFELSAKTYFPLRLIIDSLRRIVDYSVDISEATLDLTTELYETTT